MRNLREYPVNTSEIVELLREIQTKEQKLVEDSGVIGSMTPVVLEEAIERILHDATFMVRRVDDSGNIFVVRDGLSWHDASALYNLLTDRGHKQVYHICSQEVKRR